MSATRVVTRVAVFIDYQNTYRGARQTMGWQDEQDYTLGQVNPLRLGVLLTDRGRRKDPHRELKLVKVFRGEPSARHDRVGQAACQRQVRFWQEQAVVTPVTRPLKYYVANRDETGAPCGWAPREKGIDVLIALHMVMGARNDEFDVAVLMSADSDLAPAVEAVWDLGKRAEVAAWVGPYQRGHIAIRRRPTWCHRLTESDYSRVSDRIDYTLAQRGNPP